MKIVVHIDRLILDGIGAEPGDAPRIRAALEAELTRRLSGAPRDAFAGGAVPRIAAPQIRAGRTPEATGTHVAAAVAAGLRGSR
jgi:hypothetical protein